MKKVVYIMLFSFLAINVFAQFEAPKLNTEDFEDVSVKVGGDFALQLQMLDHSVEGMSSDSLVDLKNNINLPTANLNLTSDLAPGIQLHMNVFLSSRHHNEAWVEGGYMTIDALPFLPAADGIMEYITIKAGVMTPNYGDAHFFRSTNADVTKNPFVGNWIMDAYTTNPGIEIMYRNNGILAMVGTNNGRMNYGRGNDIGKDLVLDMKLGYDKQIDEDLRLRGTVSGYYVPNGHSGSYLWGGDRAGARYYNVVVWHDDDNFRSGRWDPSSGQTKMFSYMVNLYAEYKGLEVFGIYENMNGDKLNRDKTITTQHYTQTAVQAIYNINNFYVGGRYNNVSDNNGSTVTRYNLGGGFFMTDNVLLKLDYVNQLYDGPAHNDVNTGINIDGGKFNGLVFEAAISF